MLTTAQIGQITQANIANILKKLKEGKTLTAVESRLVQEAKDTDSITEERQPSKSAKNLEELADCLAITTRTLRRWKKKYTDYPKNRNIEAWVLFKEKVSGGGSGAAPASSAVAKRKQMADAKKSEKQVEKLELEIAKTKGDLISRAEVREAGQKLGLVVHAAFSRLARDFAARLEGKNPAERQVEIVKVLSEVQIDMKEELENAGIIK
tara:strand:+ start:680 stop:1306 length:627 start_codon:yes stop_codon:yes gene_type:complete